ncbi:MAG: hypothetical protein E5Y16_16470 [Mesorhizobium sp.]|uniref:transposase n=1 Tax=Mesorhizobium sp. TaxID=1871066 RepID=UPI000FE8F589|nr:MAG: hypothetical protein EOS83_32685 [Mesorhizobium sp.]TIQ02853.1 MAG: hypothetical protein E5X57_31990 [Mesorhizobium sp.]TJV37044.1 MAG: hypothetical protein E5Y16_16470 [Mesorhizobium sp.]
MPDSPQRRDRTPGGHDPASWQDSGGQGDLRRLFRRIRAHWPATRILVRGDGHYGRAQVMAWCDDNAVDYLFGLPTRFSSVSSMKPPTISAPAARSSTSRCCAVTPRPDTRRNPGRRNAAPAPRIEATTRGLDIRFVVTNLDKGSAEQVYEVIYCARGQAENLIKMHKSQLASDRTRCRSPTANQVWLFLHTATYWLMLTLREVVPTTHHLSNAEFATLRLLKLGARITETVSRIRLAFAAACPRQVCSERSPSRCSPKGHFRQGSKAPPNPILDPPARSKVQSQLQ